MVAVLQWCGLKKSEDGEGEKWRLARRMGGRDGSALTVWSRVAQRGGVIGATKQGSDQEGEQAAAEDRRAAWDVGGDGREGKGKGKGPYNAQGEKG